MELLFIVQVLFCWVVCHAFSVPEETPEDLKKNPTKFCADSTLTENEGTVSSPFYPSNYPSHLSCTWHIQGRIGDSVTIRFDDLDIEESCCCETQPCCYMNWLKIGTLSNGTERKYCGKELPYYHTTLTSSNKLWIKFHVSYFKEGGRGFRFQYKRAPSASYSCKNNEFKCVNAHQCVPAIARCNGFPDCGDGSDEHHCSNRCSSGRSCTSMFQCYEASSHCDGKVDCPDFSDEIDCGFCSRNLTRCGLNSTKCYNPLTQRCDRVFDCLNGEDEVDCSGLCPGKVRCDSKWGCYTMKQRCNGVTQCADASDELNCVPELCNYEHGGFLCDNGRCIQEVWTCDRTDDCGDLSDERNCLRNSVLTAAVMGSLICALLLVIAISCTCRLHALRMIETRISSTRETPLSRLSREFFFREPPPSYAVAVQGDPRSNLCIENLHYGAAPPEVHRSRRPRSRRSRHRPPHRSTSTSPDDPGTVPSTSAIMEVDGTVVSGYANQSNRTLKVEDRVGPGHSQAIKVEGSSTSLDTEQSSQVMKVEGSGTSMSPGHGNQAHKVEGTDLEQRDRTIKVGGSVTNELEDVEDDLPIVLCGAYGESVGLDTLAGSTSDPESASVGSCDTRFYCDSDTDPLIV